MRLTPAWSLPKSPVRQMDLRHRIAEASLCAQGFFPRCPKAPFSKLLRGAHLPSSRPGEGSSFLFSEGFWIGQAGVRPAHEANELPYVEIFSSFLSVGKLLTFWSFFWAPLHHKLRYPPFHECLRRLFPFKA